MNKVLAILAMTLITISLKAQDASSYYNEGMQLKNNGKSVEALRKFKKATEIKTDYTAAYYEIGWCLNDTKDYIGAIKILRQVRINWPEVAKLHFELGFAFEKSNQIDSAIQCYNTCLQYKKDYSNAFKQLGLIAYNKEDYDNALRNFDKFENATTILITDYLYWYKKGFCLNAIKKYEEAKIALANSIENKADYVNTYLELGFANTKLKLNDDAIKNFNIAKDMDPTNHIPYNGIAEVYRDNIKDYDNAISWYQKALNTKPDERKACYGMGYCLNSKKQYNDAIPYLQKAIEKEPSYAAAYVELGYSHYKIKNYSKAEINLNKAISVNSKNDNAHYYLALLYIEQKEKIKAQMVIDKMKAFNSKNVAGLQEKINKLN